MDGDFETFFNALPQGVQDNISAETIQEHGKKKSISWAGCRRTLPRMCPAMRRNTLTKSVLNLSFLVTRQFQSIHQLFPGWQPLQLCYLEERNKMRKRGIFYE